MTTLIVLLVASGLISLAYRSGKQTGSQKGYAVGRRRGRRPRSGR